MHTETYIICFRNEQQMLLQETFVYKICQNFSAALAATVRSFPLTFEAGLPETQAQ